MEDAAEAPLSEFSESVAGLRDRFEVALTKLRAGEDPVVTLAALRRPAEAAQLELASLYAEALTNGHVDALPPAARLEVLLQVAWLSGQHDDRRATTLLIAKRALELSPADERALAIAEPLLLALEDYAELSRRFTLAAMVVGTEARARSLLEHAIHSLEAIPAATAALLDLTEKLAHLPRLRESEGALLAAARGGGAAAAAAIVKLGERWLAEGRAREGAQQLPTDLADFRSEQVLDMLERVFDQAEDTQRLQQVLRRRVELETTALGRGRALEKLGRFHQELEGDPVAASGALLAAAHAYLEVGEPDDAERVYERLLDALPDHVGAATALMSLRGRAGNFQGVADAFAVVLRETEDNRQVSEVLLSVASAAERASAAQEFAELADDVLWRLSSDERELSERLLRTSAALFAAQTRHDDAAELYRRLITDHATSEDLDAYQALIDSNPSSEWRCNQQRWLFEWQEHHSSDRPTILLAWARFEEDELGDPEAAISVLARAAELAPERPEIWENLARLRLADGDGAGGLLAANQLRRLGRDVDPSLLSLLLEYEPGARWAVDRVKLTLSTEQRWPELFELYDRAIAATPDDRERAAWLDEAAIAARDVAQDPPRAVGYWERFVELAPPDARVDLALERLYEQLDAKPALIRHLERRLAWADAGQRATLEPRITKLSLEIGALGDALSSIERLRETSPDQADALLEQLFERSVELAATDGGAREPGRRAAELLRARFAELGQPENSARLLRAELGLALETSERRELLAALSRVCERELADLAGAFDAARELFLSTLAERDRKRLEKLAKKLGRWAELGQAYAEAAVVPTELDAQRALWRRAAEIAAARLQDAPRAIELYRRLLALEPEQARDVLDALEQQHGDLPEAFEALCQLLSQARRSDELSALLVRATETRPTPALFSRLARLQADELGDPAGAIASHLAASDVRSAGEVFLRQPSTFGCNFAPLLDLSRRLVAVGLPQGALRVLRHQLAYYADRYPPERKPVQLELIKTLDESGATEEAQRELSEAAKRFPTDGDVQRACATAAVAGQDWDRAEQCYRTLLLVLHGSGGDGNQLRRASVYVELSAIKLGRGDEPAAGELLESAFESALGDVTELMALAESAIAHRLWDAVERAATALLELAPDLKTSARALSGFAELQRQDRRLAPALVPRAVAAAQAAVQRFEELTEPSERSRLLAACVSLLPLADARQLLLTAEPELVGEDGVTARVELARRLLDEADAAGREQAIATLQAVLSHPHAPTAAWDLLARAWESSGAARKLAETLDAWLEREPRNADVLGRALRLALAESDVERALELYDRLTREEGAPKLDVSAELCKLCLSAGKTARAEQLLRAEAERERQPLRRAALWVELSELLLGAGDQTAALAAAREAHRVDAGSAEAVLALAQLAILRDQRGDALALLTTHAEAKERRRGKPLARVLRLAAELRLERDELGEAWPLLVEAHQLDKSNVDTALLLGLLAIDLDRLETAAAALRVLLTQRELGPREAGGARALSLAQGYFHLARIEQHHGKKTNAKRTALRALEENPNLLPAQRLLTDLGLH